MGDVPFRLELRMIILYSNFEIQWGSYVFPPTLIIINENPK